MYKLDVGGNACALGSAFKAVWAVERKVGETFEELVGGRWREGEVVERIAEGYRKERSVGFFFFHRCGGMWGGV